MTFKEDFNLEDGIYLDTATRSIPPNEAVKLPKSMPRDYQHGIFQQARTQSSFYLETKQLLAEFIGGKADRIAFLPNREIAWNLIMHGIKDRYKTILTDWTEDSHIIAPAMENFTVEFRYDDNSVSDDELVLAYSSIDPLTGQNKSHKNNRYSLIVVDASYDLSTRDIEEYDADIIIAELSIDMLAPSPITMIYFQREPSFSNPFPSTGNISSFDNQHVVRRTDIEQYEIGTIDWKVIYGLHKSIEYLLKVGKEAIYTYKREIGKQLVTQLENIQSVNIVEREEYRTDFNSIVSITLPVNSHDVALLLDEMEGIQVRSGRICTHLAMKKLKIKDAIRISWHIYNDSDQMKTVIQTLEQILLMMN